MEGQISIAQAKPHVSTELAQGFHEVPAFAGTSPTTLIIRKFAERIDDGVEIGANSQAEMFEIVAGIDYHRQSAAQNPIKAVSQFRATDAAAKSNNFPRVAVHRNISRLFCRTNATAGCSCPPSSSPLTRITGSR